MVVVIKDIELTHFGMFHGKKISFDPKMNVFAAPNESGKSTIHAFIRGMFYGIEKLRGRASKDDRYVRYEPWEHLGGYEGKLRFEKDGVLYRIERSFQKNNKYLHLYDETHGIELIPAQEKLDELLGGLSESGYINTVSIDQLKSAADKELIAELKNFAVNMGNTRNLQVDVTRSVQILKKKKKDFESRVAEDTESRLQEQEKLCEALAVQASDMMEEKDRLEQMYSSLNADLEKEINNAKMRRIEQEDDYNHISRKLNFLRNERDDYADHHRAFNRYTIIGAVALILVILAGVLSGMWEVEVPFFSMYWPILALVILVVCIVIAVIRLQMRRRTLAEMDKQVRVLNKELERIQQDDTVSRAEEICEALRRQVQEVSDRKNRIDWELETLLPKQDTEQSLLEELREQKHINDNCREEISAIDLALEELEMLTSKIHDSFGIRLNQAASDCFAQITGGKYTSLRIDEDFSIWINTRDKLIPIESCSRGTVEQIYLCIRLAAARILSPRENMPVILDDVFAYYDNERLAETLNILKKLKNQVIIFTCHTRESSWMKQQTL